MRDEEPRTFDEHETLDPRDDAQVERWAEQFGVDPEEVRAACEAVGGNRTAVELKLQAPSI